VYGKYKKVMASASHILEELEDKPS